MTRSFRAWFGGLLVTTLLASISPHRCGLSNDRRVLVGQKDPGYRVPGKETLTPVDSLRLQRIGDSHSNPASEGGPGGYLDRRGRGPHK